MKVHQETVTLPARGRGLHDATEAVAAVVRHSGIRTGVCTVYVQHTSASLVIQENADPAVLRDLMRVYDRLAPETAEYEHDEEGPDDMPAHIKAALTRTSESIPVSGGALSLGTWQALYLFEHRRAPHTRRLVVTLIGE